MDQTKLMDQASVVVAASSFLITFSIVYAYSSMFFNSLLAAAMAGGFFWLTYLTLRWLILALRK